MGLCMHIIAQLACMSTILLIDTPMMGVVEKTAVENRSLALPPLDVIVRRAVAAWYR